MSVLGRDDARISAATRVKAALILMLALAAFVASDRWFAIVDDESGFVTLAQQPLSVTLDDYLFREGQPEHPPLAGVVLHAWLPLGGAEQWSMRLPSMLFFLAGLVGFGLVARRLGGDRAFLALLCLGVLWPLGFHFGRLADWYSLCFFLVAATTLAYVRYLERPALTRFTVFLIATVLLGYTTYFVWAIVGCLAIDLVLVRRERESWKFVALTCATLAVAYVPLWRVFSDQVPFGAEAPGRPELAPRALNTFHNFYALFASESVAPWFFYLSIPVSLCITASLLLTVRLLSPAGRRYLAYFALLFGAMVILDILNTKRLLFISGWLLVALGLALANTDKPRQRRALVLALGFVGVVGWVGILARNYYSAPRFVEPWDEIAEYAGPVIERGGVVVSNSPSFFFEMNAELEELDLAKAPAPGWAEHPDLLGVDEWSAADFAGESRVLFVRGSMGNTRDDVSRTRSWLDQHCRVSDVRRLLPDSGYALKARFFPHSGQVRFRVVLREYDCCGATPGSVRESRSSF